MLILWFYFIGCYFVLKTNIQGIFINFRQVAG